MIQKQFAFEGAKDGAVWGAAGGSAIALILGMIFGLSLLDETLLRANPDSYFQILCFFPFYFLLFGGVVGLVFGGFGGLLGGAIGDILFDKGVRREVAKWIIGIFIAFFGFSIWLGFILWTGLLNPCVFAETGCDPTVPMPLTVFLEYVFAPASAAALWSALWIRRLMRNYKFELSGVNNNA